MKKYPTTIGQYIDMLNEERNTFITESDIGEIAVKIYSLIDTLHSMGILHGDLHAENIVFDPETKDVRIIDFEEGSH